MTSVNFVALNVDHPPNGWDISRYKFHISIDNGFPFKSELFDPDNGFPLIRIRDITSGTIETRYLGEVLSEYVVQADDLLVGMDGDFNTRWWDNENALLNQRCCRIREGTEFSRRYLHYILPLQLKVINDLTYFTTVKHLSSFNILDDTCLIPPLDEQRLISRYLDKKTQQIDTLIEKIEKKIELLKEQRTSLINHYVTKGLDPNVEMKDSGVEWIGSIPKHWNVKRLKFASTLVTDKRKASEGEIKISPENVESNTGKILNFYSEYDSDGHAFLAGDILFNKLRVYLNKVVHCDFGGVSMGEMIVIRSNDISSRYLYRVLNSHQFIDHINSLSEGVKLPRPSVDSIFNSFIPIPPYLEQARIDEVLTIKLSRFDDLINGYQRKIDLTLSYRQSLISSVVTGKVRVTEEMV